MRLRRTSESTAVTNKTESGLLIAASWGLHLPFFWKSCEPESCRQLCHWSLRAFISLGQIISASELRRALGHLTAICRGTVGAIFANAANPGNKVKTGFAVTTTEASREGRPYQSQF